MAHISSGTASRCLSGAQHGDDARAPIHRRSPSPPQAQSFRGAAAAAGAETFLDRMETTQHRQDSVAVVTSAEHGPATRDAVAAPASVPIAPRPVHPNTRERLQALHGAIVAHAEEYEVRDDADVTEHGLAYLKSMQLVLENLLAGIHHDSLHRSVEIDRSIEMFVKARLSFIHWWPTRSHSHWLPAANAHWPDAEQPPLIAWLHGVAQRASYVSAFIAEFGRDFAPAPHWRGGGHAAATGLSTRSCMKGSRVPSFPSHDVHVQDAMGLVSGERLDSAVASRTASPVPTDDVPRGHRGGERIPLAQYYDVPYVDFTRTRYWEQKITNALGENLDGWLKVVRRYIGLVEQCHKTSDAWAEPVDTQKKMIRVDIKFAAADLCRLDRLLLAGVVDSLREGRFFSRDANQERIEQLRNCMDVTHAVLEQSLMTLRLLAENQPYCVVMNTPRESAESLQQLNDFIQLEHVASLAAVEHLLDEFLGPKTSGRFATALKAVTIDIPGRWLMRLRQSFASAVHARDPGMSHGAGADNDASSAVDAPRQHGPSAGAGVFVDMRRVVFADHV